MKLKKTMVTRVVRDGLVDRKMEVPGYQYGNVFIYKDKGKDIFYVTHKSGLAFGYFYKRKQAILFIDKISLIVNTNQSATKFKKLSRKTKDLLMTIRDECRKGGYR